MSQTHPSLLRALRLEGLHFASVGRLQDAVERHEQVLQARQEALGPSHYQTLESYNDLTEAQTEAGDILGALNTMTQALGALPLYLQADLGGEARSRLDGPNMPLDLEQFLSNLARANASGVLTGGEAAARAFDLHGWLNFGELDVTLSDLGDRIDLPPGPERDALRRMQETRETWAEARVGYSAAVAIQESEGADLLVLGSELREAERAFEDAQEVLQSFPRLVDLEVPRPLTASDAMLLLDPDEALLSMVLVEGESLDRLHVWLVTQAGVSWVSHDLRSGELREAVDVIRAALDLSVPARALDQPACALAGVTGPMASRPFDICRARGLHDLIFGELVSGGALTGINELLIVADGALEQLPFGVLVSDHTDPNDPEWLIENFTLVSLPNGASLRALRRSAHAEARGSAFLGFAPVEFAGATEQLPLADLPGTELEVRALAELVGGEVALREAASESDLRERDLSAYAMISFATHAFLGDETSRITGGTIDEPALLLGAGGGHDGLLTASEAATLRLDANIVLLTGCNTAAGGAQDASGLSGLAQAFFFAGARSLVVSHWHVDDRTAAALVTSAIRGAEELNLTQSEALQHAMLSLMDFEEDGLRHPFFWAPFVIVGNG